MALISSYVPPGVYTTTVYNANTATVAPNARIAVLIGEGQEYFTQTGIEVHRGSSATADDYAIENISDQATGGNTFQLTYFPVVDGSGTGTITNNPNKISVTANGLPLVVVSLNGKTGVFITQSLVPAGTNLVVNYYFKKTDTLISLENLTPQVPTYATLNVANVLSLSLATPGALGNLVSFAMTLSTTGVSDAAAVSGQGTDTISIEIMDSSTGAARTYAQILAIINAGILTADGGYISAVATGTTTGAAAAFAATNFSGGSGQSTTQIYKVANVPIVDGTNGGIVTTNPANVTVLVNSVPVTVSAVDGANGLITLLNPVVPGSSLQATYYTNTYQDTADTLPSTTVTSVQSVGYGPGRTDFTAGVDYVLSGNQISWGAAVNSAVGVSTPTAVTFDASVITATLVDQKVYLVPVIGAVTGRNSVFTLNDVPVTGSGLGVPTDNPNLISVYVGPDPVTALAAGPVKVTRLSGASATVTLYNPPAAGMNVYATYYRSVLNDHTFTLAVDVPNGPGVGTYTITDELGDAVVPVVPGVCHVTNANFANTGIVWPNNKPDLAAALGPANETITLTFQNDNLSYVSTQAVQASLTVTDSAAVPRIKFTAVVPGTTANAITISLLAGGTGAADASAITVTGNAISIETVKADNVSVRTWQDIVNLFTTYPQTVDGTGILCAGVAGADLTSQSVPLAATHLAGGAAAVTSSYANRYLVTTSRTLANSLADGKHLTGGATTPSGSNVGTGAVGATGYLGQTYIDPDTAVQFTVVDPRTALSYGYTQLPSPSYAYMPGDTLTFVVNSSASFLTGTTPTPAVPGLSLKVVTTLGMAAGDTLNLNTFNRAGTSPAVGEYYYVTYTTPKATSDFALQVFSDEDDAYAAYGQPSVQNRLSLGVQFLTENGANTFACIQVPMQTGLGVASDQSFIDAIQSLAAPIPGQGRRVNVIVPLSTSPTVQQYLSSFLTKQASPRNKGEAIGFVGFDAFATPVTMSTTAQNIANQRVIAVTPNYLGVSLQASTDADALEYPVTGEFLAAAVAGLNLASNNDVATTLTNQNVVGFTRSLVNFDEPTKNMMAVAGITVLTDASGALNVRDYKTTDPSNALTSEPYVTTTVDFINQSFRSLCKQFIGRKETSELTGAITTVLNGALSGWNNNIISAYGQLTVTPDPVDPTTYDIAVPIRPMFSLKYINITLTVNIAQ